MHTILRGVSILSQEYHIHNVHVSRKRHNSTKQGIPIIHFITYIMSSKKHISATKLTIGHAKYTIESLI